jgi:osmotically-inducible protein OsmY
VAGQCTAAIAHTARDGNLTLTGLVEFGRQREAAELAVAGLTGVRNVKDEIEITDDTDPVGVTWLVQDALDRSPGARRPQETRA